MKVVTREEFIGRHFVDAPGEEDATKARPKKAVEVAAFVRWLLSKGPAPAALTVPPEELRQKVLSLLQERCEKPLEKLCRLFQGRF